MVFNSISFQRFVLLTLFEQRHVRIVKKYQLLTSYSRCYYVREKMCVLLLLLLCRTDVRIM